MKFIRLDCLFSFLFIVSLVIFGCEILKQTTTKPGSNKSIKNKFVITGVVVIGSNQAVPDSLNCTVKYFDINLNKEVTKPVIKGAFTLENLADEKYKLEAATKIGDLSGSIYFSVKNSSLVGSTKEKNILRVILGRENVQEDPVPPDIFEGDVNPIIGIIRDNL